MKRAALLIPAAVLAVCALLPAAADPAPPKLRLPAGAAPVRYAAELWIDPAKESFEGKIEIDVSLAGPSDTIWLNARELDIRSASARSGNGGAGGGTLTAAADEVGRGFLRLSFPRSLSPGAWTVAITYTGRLTDQDAKGLFRQKDAGEWYASSQFEAIDARRAFPCFDEPSFKTPWQLTLHVRKEHMAVSNTPILSETNEPDGTKKVVFAATKPLPSYLVALGVGPFDVVPAGTAGANRVPIRMIVPKGRGAEARWAVKSTGPLLDQLEKYFGIPYPYEKLDELAIPQFPGAMENAGLVTYGSNVLLAKAPDETAGFRRSYAAICAHETAHQWLGDLVTAAWWDDIWLNEAFATWMAAKIIDRWKPEWNEPVSRAADRSFAMSEDSLVSARRVRQPIESEDDIANAFDGITYQKGAAVIAMFEGWLGEEPFRRGMQRYLKAHAGGSARAADFLAAIAEATETPAVVPAFGTFLDQPGVPLVTAELDCRSGAPKLLLTQKRFLPAGSIGSPKETWQIPICARAGDPGSAAMCSLLAAPSGELELPKPCPARLFANAESGYYRVLYKGPLLARLLADGGKHLSPAERVATMADVASLARSGDVPMATALSLVPAFANDPARQVVETLVRIAEAPGDFLVPDDLRSRYHRFVSDTFGARAQTLGFRGKPGEDEETALLRASLVGFAANEGDDPALVAEGTRLAKEWLRDRGGVDAQMVPSVLEVAAGQGDVALFQAVLAEAKRSADRRERHWLLTALGQFRDPSVVPVALGLTLSDDFDPRESMAVLRAAARGRGTRSEGWEFLKKNFDRLAARLPGDWPAAFPWLAAGFSDEAHLKDVEAFFKDKAPKYPGGPRILAQALESIHLRAALKAAQGESVREFLMRYEGKPTIDVRPPAGQGMN